MIMDRHTRCPNFVNGILHNTANFKLKTAWFALVKSNQNLLRLQAEERAPPCLWAKFDIYVINYDMRKLYNILMFW